MTAPDTVFALFVDANPIPDESMLIDSIPEPDGLLHRFKETPAHREPAPPPALRRGVLVAAVAFFAVILLGGVWLFTASQSPEPEPASPEELLRMQAISAVESLVASRNQGDIETVLSLSTPVPAGRALAERRLQEYQAGFAAAGLPTSVDCEATVVAPALATGNCTIVLTDPVAAELGAANQTLAFRYENGLLTMGQYQDDTILEVNRAYSEYLRSAQPDDYSAACQPSLYEPGSIVQSELLALTGECAAVAAPRAAEVVDWIRAGRPDG